MPWKVAIVSERFENAALNSSACHSISPETDEQRNICPFFFPSDFVYVCVCVCICASWMAPLTRMSSERWRQLTSTVSDVPHMEFSLHRKVKQSHMHATPSAWQGWMGEIWSAEVEQRAQLPHNLLLSATTHTLMFTQILAVKNASIFL